MTVVNPEQQDAVVDPFKANILKRHAELVKGIVLSKIALGLTASSNKAVQAMGDLPIPLLDEELELVENAAIHAGIPISELAEADKVAVGSLISALDRMLPYIRFNRSK